MRKIYNHILGFSLLFLSSTVALASNAGSSYFWHSGPGPSFSIASINHSVSLSRPSLAGFRKLYDTVHLRTSNLKDNRPKPYLIFSAPAFTITHKLMLGAGSTAALAYNNIESQYRVTFGNFSVNSPIHDQLTLSYSLSRDTKVTAQIFTVLGTEVTTLFSEYQLAGPYRMVRSLADRVSSGIYILKLTAGNEQMAKRIQVL